MRTVVLGPLPVELDALIARRRKLGLDRFDEVWEGEYHMAPGPHISHGLLDDEVAAVLRPLAKAAGLFGSGPFNLGIPEDYRVPDRALHRARPTTAFVQSAALVVEIVSPDDETWNKLGFYAAHGVEELLIVDPRRRSAIWLGLAGSTYEEVDRSELLSITAAELATQIDWPTVA